MTCPFCGHTQNFLTEVLAHTQTGTQCSNCWNHLSQGGGTPADSVLRKPVRLEWKTRVHRIAATGAARSPR
jgi:hypothetical protein